MNNRIAVVTDTNSGIQPNEAEKLGIYLIPMPVILDGETYFENVSIDQKTFFTRLRAGADVSTSQPSPSSLTQLWDKLLETHDGIIHLPMSSGLSGSCQSAIALAEEYGGRVQVVDNQRISITLRQSALEARAMAEQGVPLMEIAAYLKQDGLNSSIYVAVNTLEYLKRSGRVTPAGAAIGSILNIKPVLQIQGGKLDAYKKVRGTKAAIQAMLDGIQQDRAVRFAGQKTLIRGAYSGDPEVGIQWQAELQTAFPDDVIEMDPLPLSIDCHVGDGALGVGIMKDWFASKEE